MRTHLVKTRKLPLNWIAWRSDDHSHFGQGRTESEAINDLFEWELWENPIEAPTRLVVDQTRR